MTKLTQEQEDVLIGLLLSDAWLELSSPTGNPRLGFQFTTLTPTLFDYCFNVFKDLISEQPRIVPKAYNNGPIKEQISVRTKRDPIFDSYYSNFYIKKAVDGQTQNVKVFPTVSYLTQNLSDKGLAVLLMCDGSRKAKANRGYEIHTQGNGFESSARLCLALYEKFGIQSWPTLDIHKKRGLKYWNIYICSDSFNNWSTRVEQLFVQCNMYDSKMPDKPKRVSSNASKLLNTKFKAFKEMFENNKDLCGDINYELPEKFVTEWREKQQTR